MEKELFTISEFLVKFSISRASFYREVADGRLHLLKRGRRSLISRAEAERWLKALASPPQPSKG